MLDQEYNPFSQVPLTNYAIADDTDNALSRGASLKLYRERNPAAHRMRRIQILIKTRTYRVLRKRPRRYARRLSRTNGGISNGGGENVHQYSSPVAVEGTGVGVR